MPGEAGDGAAAQEALEHCNAEDEALHYTASAMFITQHMLMDNSQLYSLEDEEL